MILITGVKGFVGHHLAEACFGDNEDILGIDYGELNTDSRLNGWLNSYSSIDLTNTEAVNKNVNFSKVKTVLHLAGLAAVGPSFDQPIRYIADNSAMLINLAEKAILEKSTARFIVVSSGAVYDSSQVMPIPETGTLVSNSPYAISKVTSELLCDYYRSRGLDMIVVRPFNHIGPGQGSGFILPDLVSQARNYKNSGRFFVGNLETKRDYTDVRDVVQAYIAIAKTKELNNTLYNVCCGKSYSGQSVLKEICHQMSIDNPKIEIDKSKIRPNDIMDICGDNSRIKTDTGWLPTIPVEQCVADYITSLV